MEANDTPDFLVPAAKLVSFFAFIRASGLDPEAFLAGIDSDPEAWLDPATRVPVDLWLALNRRASAALGDPDFTLRFGASFWGVPTVLSHCLSACATFGGAIDTYVAYQEVERHSFRISLKDEGESVELLYSGKTPVSHERFVVDFVFAHFASAAARLAGGPLRAKEVRFSYAEPVRRDFHESLFGCPVSFGCGRSSVLLDLPLRSANAEVCSLLGERLDAMLRTMGEDRRYSALVIESIARRVGGKNASEASVAAELGLGVRDLQLKLKAEGATFVSLREEWLRAMALQYLEDRSLGIKEISFLLGFSEPSAFHRAFVRWTGTTPGAARARF